MTRFLNAERLAELTPIGVLIAVQYSNRRKFLSMFVLKGDLGRWKIISLSISSNLKKTQKNKYATRFIEKKKKKKKKKKI
jgi:hypothetical protein